MLKTETAKFVNSQIPQIFDKVSPIFVPPQTQRVEYKNEAFAKYVEPKHLIETKDVRVGSILKAKPSNLGQGSGQGTARASALGGVSGQGMIEAITLPAVS